MKRIVPVLATLILGFTAPAIAQQPGHEAHHASASDSRVTDNFVDGEVKKIDKDAGKITLKHGPIPNLEMPAMTMVFRTKDPSALEKLKVGDALKFKADNIDGSLTIVEWKPAS